jgi:hypothetical protein
MSGLKVLLGCLSAKGTVGPPGVVSVLEGVDERVEVIEAGLHVGRLGSSGAL